MGLGLILLGIGALLVSISGSEELRAQRLGGNVPVNEGALDSADFSAHNSPSLARDPTDPRVLAVANRIDTPRFSCALHLSLDGGASWRQRAVPAPANVDPAELCYAPDVAYGLDGTLYMTFSTLAGPGNVPSAAWLVRSEDGGRTLSRPARILGPRSFQVRLVADPRRDRLLYVTWVEAVEVGLFSMGREGNPIRFMRSEDGGLTWSDPMRVDDDRDRPLAPSLAVASDGTLIALYLDLGEDSLDYFGAHEGRGGPPYDGPWQLVSARSVDYGETWEEEVVADVVPSERIIVFIPPFPSLATGPDDSAYAAFAGGPDEDSDLRVWASSNAGESWGEAVEVTADAPDGTTQSRPGLAVAPDGRVDVAYYDRGSDPEADVLTEVSLRSSDDGGRSFGERTALSDRAFSSEIGFGSDRDLADPGSRIALLSDTGRALAAWGDTRAGTEGSGKQDISSAIAVFSRTGGISSTLKVILRVAAAAAILAGLAVLAGPARLRRLRSVVR